MNIENQMQNLENATAGNSAQVSQSSIQSLKQLIGSVTGTLYQGQILQGEVIESKDNNLVISLANNQIINAKTDASLLLTAGQMINFQVRSMGEGKIVLNPLFENMGLQETAGKALQAAGLSNSAENLHMVGTMMEEGLSINKEALLDMVKNLTDFPDAAPDTLAQMVRLNIPITDTNITQFSAYQNGQYQISDAIDQIAASFQELMDNLTGSGDAAAKAQLTQELYAFFETEGTLTAGMEDTLSGISQGASEMLMKGNDFLEAFLKNIPEALKEDVLNQLEENQNPAITKLVESMKQSVENGTWSGKIIQENTGFQNLNGFLKQIMEQYPEFADKSLYKAMTEPKTLTKDLTGFLTNNWLMNPKNAEKQENFSRLFERISEQSARLETILNQSVKTDTPTGKEFSNIHQNVEFMNGLNQTFHFIQIPLKMNGNKTHGELYVYSKKKSLVKAEDDSVSALLHLDMANLGPVDVYVKLKETKVSTQFCLRDEAALDLIEQNIAMLDERLNKRGYFLQSEFKTREKSETAFQELVNVDKNIPLISTQSFDVRA